MRFRTAFNLQYSMGLTVKNKSNFTLKPAEPERFAFDYGEMEQEPEEVPPRSTGFVGKLHRKSTGAGLWGLVAYNCPDPDMKTIFHVQMPAQAGSINKVWVGVVQKSTPINQDLCKSIQSDPEGMGFSHEANHRYEQDGKMYILYIRAVVKDPKAYHTSANIELQIDRIINTVDLEEDPLGGVSGGGLDLMESR